MASANTSEEQSMWEEILASANRKNAFNRGTLIVLGDADCGKKTLIGAMQKSTSSKSIKDSTKGELVKLGEVGSKAAALDNSFLSVRDDADGEEVTKLSIWMVNDPANQDLIKGAFRPEMLRNTACCIVLDLSQPWTIEESLSKWLEVITNIVGEAKARFTVEERDALENKVKHYVRCFEEPEFDENGRLRKKVQEGDEENAKSEIPLGENVLVSNLGIPIIVIGTKSDELSQHEKSKEGESALLALQKYLRECCLTYGASLVYTSVSKKVNLDILYDYLLHRLYNLPLKYKTQFHEHKKIFIPSGRDSMNLIEDFTKGAKSLQSYFSDPNEKKANKNNEVICESWQNFLGSLKGDIKDPEKGQTKTTADGAPNEKLAAFFAGLLNSKTGGS